MSKIEAYIECHYFASGFKSVFVGADKRPNILPNADSVGLSNEIQLKSPDFAVEITRRNNGRNLTWIGVYKASVDLDYGDRGNYCGIGVWLVDCSPSHSHILIKSLLGLCAGLENASPSKAFLSSVNEFYRDYLFKCLISNDVLPTSVSGLPYFKDRYDNNKYIRLDNDSQSRLTFLINSLRSMVFAKQESEYNRILYIIGNSSKLTVSSINDVDPINDVSTLESLFASLLSYNSESVIRDKAFDQKNGDLLNSNIELMKVNEVLSTESKKSITLVNELKAKITELENKIKISVSSVNTKSGFGQTGNAKQQFSANDISNLSIEINRLSSLIARFENYEHNNLNNSNSSVSERFNFQEFVNEYRKYIFIVIAALLVFFIGWAAYQHFYPAKSKLPVSEESSDVSENMTDSGLVEESNDSNVRSDLPSAFAVDSAISENNVPADASIVSASDTGSKDISIEVSKETPNWQDHVEPKQDKSKQDKSKQDKSKQDKSK
jgi:hypothetical protein